MTVLLAIFGPDTVHLSTLDIGQRKFYKKYLPDLILIFALWINLVCNEFIVSRSSNKIQEKNNIV